MIRACEAYTNMGAIQTILNGKRDIAFIVISGQKYISNTEAIISLNLAIKNNLNLLPIKSRNEGIAFIVYKNNKDKALKLLEIAESHNGYLKNVNPEESELIGNLLEYHPDDINEFIKRVYHEIL